MSKCLVVWCTVLVVASVAWASPRLHAQTGQVELRPWEIPTVGSKNPLKIASAVLASPDCEPDIVVDVALAAQSPLMTDAKARLDYANLLAHNLRDRKCPKAVTARITMLAATGIVVEDFVIDVTSPSVEPVAVKPDTTDAMSKEAPPVHKPPRTTDAGSVTARVDPAGKAAELATASTDAAEAGAALGGFSLEFWIELTFAAFIGLLVLFIHLLAESRRTDALLQAPSTVRKVLFSVLRGATLLTPREGNTAERMILAGGDVLSTRFSVPATRGIFWHQDRLEVCWLAYVPVPPGMIARVEAKEVSVSPILDTSRAVTIPHDIKDGRLSVTALERGVRWQITSPRGIDTQDGYGVRLHLAVHSWIEAPADSPCITRLFDEHAAYPNKVRDWALATLSELLARRTYAEALCFGDILIDDLNQRWRERGEALLGVDVSTAISTQFTAVVIKPRQEAEHLRFARTFGRVADVEDRIKQLQEKNDNLIRELHQVVFTHYGNMSTSLAALLDPNARQKVPRIPHKGSEFRRKVHKLTEEIGGTISKSMGESVVQRVVKKPFELGINLLKHSAEEYISACNKLAAAVQRLRLEQRHTMREVKDPTSVELPQHRHQDLPR